jgi:hypothetical protein
LEDCRANSPENFQQRPTEKCGHGEYPVAPHGTVKRT